MKESSAVAEGEKPPEAAQQGSPGEERMETCGDANENQEKEKRREAKVRRKKIKFQRPD